MSTTFSPNSLDQIGTLEGSLAQVVLRARAWSRLDFQVSQGARTIEQQQAYFDAGRSKVNPKSYPTKEALYAAAKHVTGPGAPLSRAVDVFVPGQPAGAYDKNALSYLCGVFDAAAKSLGVKIRWGGDFDRDGVLVEAGTFQDLPHFELDQ